MHLLYAIGRGFKYNRITFVTQNFALFTATEIVKLMECVDFVVMNKVVRERAHHFRKV